MVNGLLWVSTMHCTVIMEIMVKIGDDAVFFFFSPRCRAESGGLRGASQAHPQPW